MRTFVGVLPQSSLPLSVLRSKSATGNQPTPSGTSESFEDVLQQQEGAPALATELKGKAPVPATITSGEPALALAAPPAGKNQEIEASTELAAEIEVTEPAVLATPELATSETATPPSPAIPSVKSKPAALSSGSSLSAMIVRASIQASASPTTLVSSAPFDSTATAPATPENASTPAATPTKNPPQPTSAANDLTTMIAQATILAGNVAKTSVGKSPADPATTIPSKSDKDSGSETTPAKSPVPSLPGGVDLSTIVTQASVLTANTPQNPALIVSSNSGKTHLPTIVTQASIQTANTKQTSQAPVATISTDAPAKTAVALGNELPLAAPVNVSAGTSITEKKSTSAGAKGSFLQPNSPTTSPSSNLSGLMAPPLTAISESTGGQQVTSSDESKNLPLNGLSKSASTLAGTANVEQDAAMNASLNNPAIFSTYGANTPARQNPADLNILLSSNNDFQDALTQVMHVAQLTQTNESRAPMRVEMEIQTPPGAIVNVYVSRQNDQWRAQLSTNDPQALSWVQDQMSSLRQSNSFGVEVRWLPPQMESSSSQNPDLSWDRGGQGQAGYQQPDERSQSQRQKKAGVVPAIAAVQSSQFMNTLTALGRAA